MTSGFHNLLHLQISKNVLRFENKKREVEFEFHGFRYLLQWNKDILLGKFLVLFYIKNHNLNDLKPYNVMWRWFLFFEIAYCVFSIEYFFQNEIFPLRCLLYLNSSCREHFREHRNGISNFGLSTAICFKNLTKSIPQLNKAFFYSEL